MRYIWRGFNNINWVVILRRFVIFQFGMWYKTKEIECYYNRRTLTFSPSLESETGPNRFPIFHLSDDLLCP